MAALVESMGADHPGRPVLVVSNSEEAGGLKRARDLGVETACVPHFGFPSREDFEHSLTKKLEAAGTDLICLAGFMRVLTPAFVARWQGRILNIHPSLLPKYPGLNTHARAIDAGDHEAGCSVHIVTAELDGGPILGQARVPVLPGDSPKDLAARVLKVEHKLYPAVLRQHVNGETTPLYLP